MAIIDNGVQETILRNSLLMVGCLFTTIGVAASPLAIGGTLRLLTIGDSHAAIEGGFAQDLAEALNTNVEHVTRSVVGATISDLVSDLEGKRDRFHLGPVTTWNPHLVLVALGTNDAKNWSSGRELQYVAAWRAALDHLQTSYPASRIFILGPPDADLPGLAPVRSIQATVSFSSRIQYIDRTALMGGEGSMRMWREAKGGKYATADGIHLSSAGYSELAKRVARVLAQNSGFN